MLTNGVKIELRVRAKAQTSKKFREKENVYASKAICRKVVSNS